MRLEQLKKLLLQSVWGSSLFSHKMPGLWPDLPDLCCMSMMMHTDCFHICILAVSSILTLTSGLDCVWLSRLFLITFIVFIFSLQGKAFSSIQPQTNINDVCMYPNSGENNLILTSDKLYWEIQVSQQEEMHGKVKLEYQIHNEHLIYTNKAWNKLYAAT